MKYIFLIRRWKKRWIGKYQNAVDLKGTTAFFISTQNYSNLSNLTLFMGFYVSTIDSAPNFRRVRFFNVTYWKYLSLTSGRSPPSVLISHKNQTEVKNEKNHI